MSVFYQLRESKVAVAQTLKRGVEVAASWVSSLEDPNGQQTPQTTDSMYWNNTSCVLQLELVLCKAAEVVEDHRHR